MPIIEVDHVTKEFQLGQFHSFKQTALNGLRRLRGQPVERRKPFKALDDVSFKVEEGEVLGIIGHNGAGKSTLLKLLANISKPTTGRVTVQGRVAPLIEVGAGLIGDLTGRENIFLNATILGMKRAEIKRKFDEIVAFAELEEFIDTPIKRYSSGMHVRLGFSIATCVEFDILIVDEVLAVGDLAFQRKCFDRIESLIKHKGRTILIVSHNIRQVERICQRVLLLDHGHILCDGDASVISNRYYKMNDTKLKNQAAQSNRIKSTGDVELVALTLFSEGESESDTITYGSQPTFKIRLRVRKPLHRPLLVFGFHTIDFFYVWTTVSPRETLPGLLEPGEYEFTIRILDFPFFNGVFSVRVSIDVGEVLKNVLYGESLLQFKVEDPNLIRTHSEAEGIVKLPTRWSMEYCD